MQNTSTKNRKGFTYIPTHISNSFIEEFSSENKTGLDIGAAYGVTTIPALRKGGTITAVDTEAMHIEELINETPESLRPHLHASVGTFPYIDFSENSFDAIHISQVFPFLTGEEIELGAAKLHSWLKPGGKLYVVSFTPFLSHCSPYLPIYQEKKENGEKWAGYIENLYDFCNNETMIKNLPPTINHVDKEDMERTFSKQFSIESLYYFGDENYDLPQGIKYDDRERIGLIAVKI